MLGFCRFGSLPEVVEGFSLGSVRMMLRSQQAPVLLLLLLLGCNYHMLHGQEVAPYLRGVGLEQQVVLEGNRLVLTCLAGGSWPLQYRWSLNSSNITDWTPQYRLFVPSLQRTDAGLYQCTVRNRMGAIIHGRTEVQVAFMGRFSGQEQRTTVSQGQAAVLSPPPLASFPQPLATWYKDGHKIIPNHRIAIALDNQLVVLATTTADAGRYHAEAVNEMTGDNVTSPAVYLSISVGKKSRGSTDLESDVDAPAIVIGPKDTTVLAGTKATLECIANARDVDSLLVVWKRDGRHLASGRQLVIPVPTSSDSGEYVCEALLDNSTAKVAQAKAHLTVIEPPSLTAQPQLKIIAQIDKNVEIPCLATGVPPPRLEWYKDAVPLSKLANPRYKVTSAAGLTVRRVQPGDGGIFQCFARNVAGETQAHTQLLVSNAPPTFTARPSDKTVTEGNTALFICQTSGAPKPGITWRKGLQVLASGSVQVPRFTLLQSGSLQVQPVSFQDSGEYTCFASNPEKTINATAKLTVLSRTIISVPPSELRVIKGTTAFLACNATHDPRVNISYKWERGGAPILTTSGGRVSVRQGSLTIGQTWSGDIGDYTCTVISRAGNDSRSARLEVIELPHSPRSLAARLNDSDSRSVLLSWLRPFDGNSPLLYYLLELSENNSPWKVYLSEVDPTVTNISVGGLTPARTYQFRLCAVNHVGRGQYSAETQRLMLREEAPSAPPKNIVASGRTNQSIMVQWQPPPEPQLNGVLRGYMLRYRLAGLPGDYQEKNISSPETNYCLLKELIIWTQYQIQVAAYTGAGLGVYSSPVSEYTLQGVPTAPPQEVEVVAINSTTIRFTWNPPPQQFINGINQGYKLLVWPEQAPEDVTVVTITPDYPSSRHTGLVGALKKFTWYFASILCFTTPGDGPRSPPTMLQTHEDTPGPVRHLSFTKILDTSVQVSWAEPEEKNGIVTGYTLWWEVFGVQSRREERALSNSTLQYQLTGLTSTTTYTLKVAALTAAGRGVVTSANISTGVPPELPGAPSNLVISNISPRTVTLRFRPGSDGKTAISRWIVEGQVVKEDGAEDAWRVVYQLDNQAGADSLEIPNLTPFTQYRFRMQQVNIVGSSPLSSPSRLIQTLQAAPDTHPSNLTVLSPTQSGLCFRWKPLPESEYNGSPETVGYRLRVRRTDGLAEDRTVEVEGVTGEVTVEGLDPWTYYRTRIQAYNSIGPGPWSDAVSARTAESVPSGAPVNVTADAVSSTKILLTWSPVPQERRNGAILGYKVLYSEKDSQRPPTVLLAEGERNASLLLGALRKYTVYSLQVSAFTRMGDGPPSSPVILRTKEDVPGPPVRVVFPEVRLSSARVVWEPPTNPNGIILGYQIAYRLEHRESQQWTTVEVGSNGRQFTVTGLTLEQTYVFRLMARTAVGWGQEHVALVVTTERRERPQPPRKLAVPQDGVEARRLRLHWVTGSSGSSPVRYLTVQIKELPDGDWITNMADIPHNLTSWTVDGLKPFTSYRLRMVATNDIGNSVLSKETDAVTTLQDIPEEPPEILTVKPSTTTSVMVQWKRPSDQRINGVLTGYRLYYRELPANSTLSADVLRGSKSTTDAHITTKSTFKTVSSSSLTEFELTQLKKFKRYQIVMTSYNIVGESPPSEPIEVSVGEAAPSVAPQSIRVSAVSSSSLEVSWDMPPLETQNGLIQGYKVHYWQKNKQNQTEKVKVIFVPDTRMHLSNLSSYTHYLVTLTAFNTAGDGPPSDPRGAQTMQSAPSQPSYLSFSEVTGGSVNVSWGAPLTPNGLLEGYQVIYQPTAPVQGVSKVVTVDVKGNWQRWLKVRDLVKGVTYTFTVYALTVSYGPPISANLTAEPVQGSPGSPIEISITKASSALTIHWAEGDSGAAPISGYVIESRPSDEGVWDSFIRLLSPSTRSVSIPMERLRPGISYEFRVIAVNRFGFGQPSTPSAALAALSERPFYEEWWFLLVMALVGLILILILVFALLLHGHSNKYKACGTGKHMSSMEESVTLDNGGFTTLELNSRALTNTKNTFLKKNGTRSPPRPSPGGLHYSDEDICNNYNGAVLTESTTLTEKPTEVSESELTDSDYEDEQPKHSFVNHYMSDPTYYNSWKRQPKGLKALGSPFSYEECAAAAESEPYYQTVVTQHSAGGVYTPTGQPALAHANPNTNPPGSRTPVTGFSSFV
ncbi:protein sidekick-1 isoform X1 [Syngnathus scovelli]|uniref:protein sidekick-1 isoform X1 n=1 Tax=Syngnathus scovelli TaxID=161590 RepID=UPI00210F6B4F|nr:protein sidekick-1 isoform X1 [Syngnathus scovelli]XP_049577113.1 protein sidekick-1 isoform X1 [Syngnathus scovelli]XP_049577114.1 protein sidekick-1 isoform X1 [Syngnathus scovelli]XP_049577115.1 protein sidekick-1 isoform X1 [Syngnathus scovelli]XP_049577116.1 protein sidekick-1 isoform X1 [Syngnathus scovelli]